MVIFDCIMTLSEFELDPKPLATGAYGQVFKGIWP